MHQMAAMEQTWNPFQFPLKTVIPLSLRIFCSFTLLLYVAWILYKLNLIVLTASSWHSFCVSEGDYKVRYDACFIKMLCLWADAENINYNPWIIPKRIIIVGILNATSLDNKFKLCVVGAKKASGFLAKILACLPFPLPIVMAAVL